MAVVAFVGCEVDFSESLPEGSRVLICPLPLGATPRRTPLEGCVHKSRVCALLYGRTRRAPCLRY
jgi:hypothetical protein